MRKTQFHTKLTIKMRKGVTRNYWSLGVSGPFLLFTGTACLECFQRSAWHPLSVPSTPQVTAPQGNLERDGLGCKLSQAFCLAGSTLWGATNEGPGGLVDRPARRGLAWNERQHARGSHASFLSPVASGALTHPPPTLLTVLTALLRGEGRCEGHAVCIPGTRKQPQNHTFPHSGYT